MSRLIIKNLPTYVTPIQLKEHFEQKGGPRGTLTDYKVALKPDGTSRRFGFVGYKTEREALSAKEYFDRTFIDSTRISVNVVEGARDAPTPRPNKRQRIGPSPNDVAESRVDATPLGSKAKSNAQLDEFMRVMQPRSKTGPAWANEARENPTIPVVEKQVNTSMEEAEIPEGLSDLEWMKKHMSQAVDSEKKVFEQDAEEVKAELPQISTPTEPLQNPTFQAISETARLFVRNLAFSCTDGDLQELFGPFGELTQVHIPLDPSTKLGKGLAFITFAQSSNALAAFKALDKTSFQGRLLHLLPAIDRKPKSQSEDSGRPKKTVKDEKSAKRKAMAGKEFNWSMLYMNSDAVASSIADRMNLDKSDILNPESGDNAAVKLALAETHIIQETKAYLESQGVLLSSFSSKARSDTTILVKNIPYGTTADHIREIFQPHGELSRVLVPPAGTMGVVDYERPDEAAKAFRAVAYRRLGNSILYLERGPLGMFDGTRSTEHSTLPMPTSSATIKIAEQTLEAEEEQSITGGSTLFIKNLSFSTSQDRLTQAFRHLPSFSFARIQTKPDPKRPDGPRLSMGYGFVGFNDVESAKKAMISMQGFALDGHALHVKFAGRGVDEGDSKLGGGIASKSRTTKLIVKNIPFEATKKDIRDLFASHGHLKSVRLPKKFDSRTRGFAFLEFVTRHEAENAYAALRHTHLLGRHLVIEWADEAEQDLNILRQKAGVGLGDGKALPGRKQKFDISGKSSLEDVEDLES